MKRHACAVGGVRRDRTPADSPAVLERTTAASTLLSVGNSLLAGVASPARPTDPSLCRRKRQGASETLADPFDRPSGAAPFQHSLSLRALGPLTRIASLSDRFRTPPSGVHLPPERSSVCNHPREGSSTSPEGDRSGSRACEDPSQPNPSHRSRSMRAASMVSGGVFDRPNRMPGSSSPPPSPAAPILGSEHAVPTAHDRTSPRLPTGPPAFRGRPNGAFGTQVVPVRTA